jgi:glucose-1-phosphate thymidylyltransferase
MNKVKGIILAGGSGTRLGVTTKVISKQLLPIGNKPMIYYPLSVLLLAGIRDILIITTSQDRSSFERLLEDGSQFGVKIQYAEQERPNGIAQAFTIGEKFIGKQRVALILGDNIFYGAGLSGELYKAINKKGAVVYAHKVSDPERYGVVEIDKKGEALSLEEKPQKPKSNWAVVGLYFYDSDVVKMVKNLKPSSRGELEITDLNKEYLKRGNLSVLKLPRGGFWLDSGTHESILQASNFISTIEINQGITIACLEEISLNQGWITCEQALKVAEAYKNNSYGQNLYRAIVDKIEFMKDCKYKQHLEQLLKEQK